MEELLLTVITPGETYGPIPCDSVRVTIPDNAAGTGGGSYGIRPGHISALLVLDAGSLQAFSAGRSVFTAQCGCGFASVEHNRITAVTEDCRKGE